MPLNDQVEDVEGGPTADEQFIDSFAAKFAAQDEAADRAASGDADTDSEAADATDATGADEHTDADTSADDSDGNAADSDTDSEEREAADHTDDEDESSEESDDDADAETDDQDAAEEEGAEGTDSTTDDDAAFSEEFETKAKELNVSLKLDDIPAGPARELVRQKLKHIDSAFTRAQQDLRAYRQEEVQFRADKQFFTDHPEIVITEILLEKPELLETINEQLTQLQDNPNGQKAFKIVARDERSETAKKIQQTIDAKEQHAQRVSHVIEFTRKLAGKVGLPFEFAERAVALAVTEKGIGLTDAEVTEAVKAEATIYTRHVRAHRREASKKVIQDRTANRQVAPGSKAPASARSPKPAPAPRRKPIDFNNEDDRIGLMMETARRVLPGKRDQ